MKEIASNSLKLRIGVLTALLSIVFVTTVVAKNQESEPEYKEVKTLALATTPTPTPTIIRWPSVYISPSNISITTYTANLTTPTPTPNSIQVTPSTVNISGGNNGHVNITNNTEDFKLAIGGKEGSININVKNPQGDPKDQNVDLNISGENGGISIKNSDDDFNLKLAGKDGSLEMNSTGPDNFSLIINGKEYKFDLSANR